jgi:ribosomal protein L4
LEGKNQTLYRGEAEGGGSKMTPQKLDIIKGKILE